LYYKIWSCDARDICSAFLLHAQKLLVCALIYMEKTLYGIVASLSLWLLCSCIAYSEKVVTSSTSIITVKGNTIYREGKPFAELRYFDTFYAQNSSVSHRGVAIYYYKRDQEVWIFPIMGWSIRHGDREYISVHDLNKLWFEFRGQRIDATKGPYLLLGGKRPSKEQILTTRVYDVHISEDGKYVTYRTQGMLFGSTHRYSVELDSVASRLEGGNTLEGR